MIDFQDHLVINLVTFQFNLQYDPINYCHAGT